MKFKLDDLRNNIKLYRSLKKITQQELAEKCEISTSYIADIELGRRQPSLKTLVKLSEAFDIEPYQLLVNPETVSHDAVNDFSKLLLDKFKTDVEEIKKQF